VSRRVGFDHGLPPSVIAAADATVALGGGVTKHTSGRTLVEVRFSRPQGYALELLTGLRGALCVEPDEWLWTPDRTNDVALSREPFSELNALRRAS